MKASLQFWSLVRCLLLEWHMFECLSKHRLFTLTFRKCFWNLKSHLCQSLCHKRLNVIITAVKSVTGDNHYLLFSCSSLPRTTNRTLWFCMSSFSFHFFRVISFECSILYFGSLSTTVQPPTSLSALNQFSRLTQTSLSQKVQKIFLLSVSLPFWLF